MKLRNLIVAAALLAVLSGIAWWAQKHPKEPDTSGTPGTTKVLDVAEGDLQSIDIQPKDGKPLVIARSGSGWQIQSPDGAKADASAMTSLASTLNPVSADSVVEEKAANLGQYGLATPSLAVTLHLKNGKTQQLFLGDDVPASSYVYARVGTDPKVYAVATSVKSSLNKTENDLRDKRLLTFDSTKVTRLELVTAGSDVEFGKNSSNDWQILKPGPYRADSSQVEELITKLGDAKMDLSGDVAAEAKKAATAYGGGAKTATVKVSDSGGTQTLDVRKSGDDFYAKSSAVAGVYKIPSDSGKALTKSLDDFRNKKVFDFGFSDPTRLTVQSSAGEQALSRSGTDWKAKGQTMDPGSVQSLIDKIRDLAASKFVTAGFTSPTVTISVTSNDGKRNERVEFAKTGDNYLARRENDTTLYQLEGKSMNDILDAGKAVKPNTPAKK